MVGSRSGSRERDRSVSWVLTDRAGPGQASSAPYQLSNLATNVGDDAAAVAANRRALRQAHGLPAVVWMEQVHGCTVRTVGHSTMTPLDDVPDVVLPDCDALVTAEPELALAVMVADCVPVLLRDHTAGVVGVAHAGRRGVVLGVVEATIAAMEALGARPANLAVTLGPAIGGCCYEVGPDVHAEVVAAAPEADARTRTGLLSLDLRAAIEASLHRRGVSAVDTSTVCTADRREYFSHRRDGRTGRFAGVIWRVS